MARAGIGDRVEGFHAVAAAVLAGRAKTVRIERRRLNREAYTALADDARSAGARVEYVDDVRDIALTSAPQGVVAECRPKETVSMEDAVAATDPSALLVFDHLEDQRNLGASIRSAVAAGFKAAVVPKRRSAPIGAAAFKAAAGTLEEVALVEVSSIPEALRRLEKLGVWRVGLDGAGERSLFGFDLLAEPVAVVVGAEGKGLHRLTAERCDVIVQIPHAGPAESLNASVATALAVFEVSRARGWVS
ncbi:MAG: 23S rRNA (guanosine(2251)-2'-O)-methyltransferase RlmB [Actinomycetota bacterium]|nr:23S rRNA (guanosine(2251)-2'-O)-methyltransferase RlmB [Actinomycetota bacterium]